MLTVPHNSNAILNDIKRWNTEKCQNNFWNQIANMKKKMLATFAEGVVDSLCLLQQNKSEKAIEGQDEWPL